MEEKLPKGWVKTTLGELTEPSRFRALPSEIPDARYVGLEHIESQTMKIIGHGYARDVRSSSIRFSKRDVLYGKMRPYLNKVWIAEFDGLCSAEFFVFSTRKELNAQFLAFRLNAEDFVTFSNGQVTGERPRVDFEKLSHFPVLLPPLSEQQRISDKLHSALSRVERAKRISHRAEERLENYRTSVLNAAITGELTHDWRRRHSETKLVKQSRGAKSLPELNLPSTWNWLLSTDIFSFVTSGSRGWARYYSKEGALFIRVGNLSHDSIELDLRSIQRVRPPSSAETSRTRVVEGDLLISITADVGMVALVQHGLGKAYINQHVAIARPTGNMNAKYLAYFLSAKNGGQAQFLKLQRGATKAGLGLDDIRNIWVAKPPLSEQRQIVREIERRLSASSRLAATLEQQAARAQVTRQSLLREAFVGRLVPQNSRDESASALLERIRAAREVEAQKPKTKPMPKSKLERKIERRGLLDVLREHKTPMTPEALFRAAGYTEDSVEAFFAELRELTAKPAKVKEQRIKADLSLLEFVP